MKRSARHRWPIVLAMVVLLAMTSVTGAATTPGRAGFRLAVLGGVDAAEAPTAVPSEGPSDQPWWEITSMDADRDGMFDSLDELVDSGSRAAVDVLVDLDHTPTDAEGKLLATLAGSPCFSLFPAIGIVGLIGVLPSEMSVLLEVPGVVMLEPRIDAVPLQDVASRALKAQDSVEYSPNTSWELGYTGSGVVISIMDTGVDDAHSGLTGKFVAGVDFTKPSRPRTFPRDGTYNPDDQAGHGTTCAGIATGTGAPGGDYIGAAPDAYLVDLRIGTRFGFSPGELPQNTYDAALQAIDWAASHSDTVWPGGSVGIDINSLSWGIPFDGTSDGSDGYSRGLDQCVLEGIVSCVAAGNEGPNNVGVTGMSASSRSIVVGSLDDQNTILRDDDVVASYSSRGPRTDDNDDYPYDELKPDVTAPGTNINGVVYESRGDGSGGGYGGRGSGTSYACPYVAGVSAILLEASPEMDPSVLREILRVTAERRDVPEFPTLDPFWNGDFGWGMVDSYLATLVAMELEYPNEVDVELQAFVTNVSGGTSKNPEFKVEAIAWARVGQVEYLEWRIGIGQWHSVELDGANASFTFNPADFGEGVHVLEVRAVGSDGLYSVWRPVHLEITEEAVNAAAIAGAGSIAGVCAAAVIVVLVLGIFIWRKRPDMLDKGLRMLHIER